MINKVRVTDEVEFKSDLRRMYKEIGYAGMMQIFYEMVLGAQFCMEVVKEELIREEKEME